MTRFALRPLFLAASVATLAACSSAPKPAPVVSDPLPVRTQAAKPVELTSSSRGPVLTVDDVLFDFEKASLRPEASSILAQAAAYLADNPDRNALIEGHTDTTGDARYNVMLSQARADAVSRALLANGVDARRIKAAGFGETRPVSSNGSLEGRQRNRRVEIVFPRANGA